MPECKSEAAANVATSTIRHPTMIRRTITHYSSIWLRHPDRLEDFIKGLLAIRRLTP
jgi:hypothetical protein